MQTTQQAHDTAPQQTNGTHGFSSTGFTPRNGKRNSSFEITGADGQPIEIPPGEFYFNTKARARRMMVNSLTSEARQVYACLELATMGFQQELAVIMDKGRTINLRSEHICQQTGLSTQHVRRGLAELEAAGLAERRSVNGKPLTQGNIAIYSWAIPRETARKGSTNGHRSYSIFAEFSPSYEPLVSFAKSHKIRPPENLTEESLEAARGYFNEALVAVAEAEKAQEVAAAKLKTAFARATANKDERTERTIERTVCQSVSPVQELDRPTDPLPTSPPENEIRTLLLEELGQKLPTDVPSPTLCSEISTILGDAPLDLLRNRIRSRYKAITSMGMVMLLAADVRTGWKAQEESRKKIEVMDLERKIAVLKEMAADPDETEEAREYARSQLGTRYNHAV